MKHDYYNHEYVILDRIEELKYLEEEMEKEESTFAVIYGRRRVGKTELIKRFMEGKYCVYYLADRKGYIRNIQDFQSRVEEDAKIENFSLLRLDSWVEIFKHLCDMKDKRKMLVIIDEFPYLVEEGVLSEFQKAWDEYLSKCNIFLILVGSSISMMERLTLNYSSPLYGRRTMQLKVKRLKLWDSWKFMPNYSLKDFVGIYGITDGVPYYLKQMDSALTLEENIRENVLSRDRVLYSEVEFLLRMELREFRNYFPILEAIAHGKRRFGEITDFTGLKESSLSKYLKNLRDIGVVAEDFPMFGSTKNRRYRLGDNYFSFWFRFVYPHRSEIAIHGGEIWDDLKDDFHTYLGRVFEDIVLDFVRMRFRGYSVGRWWNRKGDEIDILAVNKRKKIAYLGEIKFGKVLDKHSLKALSETGENITQLDKYEKRYLLVAPDIRVDENVVVWDFKYLEREWKNNLI